MKPILLISIAAFTVACDGSSQKHIDTSAKGTGAGSPGANASAAPASELSSSTVTLVGCLQAPRQSGMAGTSGTTAGVGASAPNVGSETKERQPHGSNTGPFVLANAALESGGVDAGGSGGSLASAGSSFELDGVPADMQSSVNKMVRVTGRLVRRAGATPSATNGTAEARGGAAATSTAGETSPRDDVRANSTGVAGDPTNNRLAVENVQVVAQQCGPQ